MLVRAKGTADIPEAVAFTLYGPPAVELAVKTGAVAAPPAPMVATADVVLPVKVPLGPLAGAINVRFPPMTGSPNELLTVTVNCVAKDARISALCPEPAVAE